MSSEYPKFKTINEYQLRVDKMPYRLSDEEKGQLSIIFREVMSNLAFYAKEDFVEKLFSTQFLVRLYDLDNQVVGFGNAAYRECGGIRVFHIMSIYVLPTCRGNNLMNRTWMYVLTEQAKENGASDETPFYFTASTVNAQVLYASQRYYDIWPDFVKNKKVPTEVQQIAGDANRFYPRAGDKLFQVKITKDYAGLKDGVGHHTRNADFNSKFYSLADPNKLELVFFVGRINEKVLNRLLLIA